MKKKTHEEYVAQLAVKNPNVEVIGKYIDIKSKILHKCRIDGYEWSIRPLNALKGYGCPICSGNIKKSHTDYIEELSEINSNIKVIGKYKNAKTAILHKCLIDNYEWKVSPTEILSGSGCPQCHESSGERRVRQWLQKQNIQFEFQKRYHDCRDKNTLPFDFYLPTYNSIIEYDDKQHFEPIEHFGGKEKFKLTVKHDDIKNEYCKKNNISILRIPYYKNVEEELNNFLFI